MGRKICVVSGKGGVGKTTVTFGLGVSLAKMGYSVCLMDLDLGLNNLDSLFDLENKVVFDLTDCLEGRCRIKQALINCDFQENLYILSSAKTEIMSQISQIKLNMLINKLAGVFDFVFIDSPAGINNNFFLAVKCSDEAILVVTPHISSIRDADKVIGVIRGTDLQSVSIVINRIRGDMVTRKESLTHLQIQSLLKAQLLGVLPEYDDINIHFGKFVFKKGKSDFVTALNILANNVMKDKKDIYDYTRKYRGFTGLIRRSLKRSV